MFSFLFSFLNKIFTPFFPFKEHLSVHTMELSSLFEQLPPKERPKTDHLRKLTGKAGRRDYTWTRHDKELYVCSEDDLGDDLDDDLSGKILAEEILAEVKKLYVCTWTFS